MCIAVILITLSFEVVKAQENPNFYLHENGVTIMCPEVLMAKLE